MTPEFTNLIDLASERLGGAVLYANDDFFAPKENLLKPAKPVFIEGKYTDRGKWMDGWESRRRRTPGFDWCLIRLGLPGALRGFLVDTSFFTGNYPEQCTIEACAAAADTGVEQLTRDVTNWTELLHEVDLKGDTQNYFAVRDDSRYTHLRFKIFPDGGVARLRAYGEVKPDWEKLRGREIDLVAVENGGRAISASDTHYGPPHNLLMPGRGKDMGDGWETKRRRGPGHDWAVIKLGAPGTVAHIEVDTAHYKGNFPESCSLEVCHSATGDLSEAYVEWRELLPRTKLEADKQHYFEKEIRDAGVATHARFNIFPDGGVGRLRLFGRLS